MGIGTAVKNSLEIVIEQVRLEGGFKRGGRIRAVECLRQIVHWLVDAVNPFAICHTVFGTERLKPMLWDVSTVWLR